MSNPAAEQSTPGGSNIALVLHEVARRCPSGTAVVGRDRTITWRQLDSAVSSAARRLSAGGVVPGDRIVVWMANSEALIIVMWAVWRAGAALVAVNSRELIEEVIHCAKTAAARIVISDRFEEVPAGADGRSTWEVLAAAAVLAPSDEVAQVHKGGVPLSRGAPCWYFTTGGTTGQSRLAVATHDQLAFIINNFLTDVLPELSSDDRCLILSSLTHAAGVHHILHVARAAATVIPAQCRFDPAIVYREIEEFSVTNFFAVPTMIAQLAVGWPRKPDRLRFIVHAGEPMPDGVREEAHSTLGNILIEYYGLVEVPGCIAVRRPDDPVATGVGRVRTGMHVTIHHEDDASAGSATPGEIWVRGPAVMAGYADGEGLDYSPFEDGWFRTGDLGFLDLSGNLHVLGRIGDEFISGGYNVYPARIENAATRSPAVVEAVAFGVPSKRWGQEGVLLARTTGQDDYSPSDLLGELLERLPRYMVPRRIEFVPLLPTTALGKVSRRAAKAEWWSRQTL